MESVPAVRRSGCPIFPIHVAMKEEVMLTCQRLKMGRKGRYDQSQIHMLTARLRWREEDVLQRTIWPHRPVEQRFAHTRALCDDASQLWCRLTSEV